MNKLFQFPVDQSVKNADNDRVSLFIRKILIGTILLVCALDLIKIISLPRTGLSDYVLWAYTVCLIFIFVAFQKKNIRFGGVLYIITTWAVMTFLAWTNVGVHDIAVIGYIICIILAINISRGIFPVIVGAISTVSVWTLFFAETHNYIIPKQDTILGYSIEFSIILILISIFIYYDKSYFLLLYGRIRDEYEEKLKIEKSLKESNLKTSAIFNLSCGFIGILDPEGKVLDANKTALEFAGIKLEDVEGKYFWETPWWTHSQESIDQAHLAVKEASTGRSTAGEASHFDEEGRVHYVDFTIRPVYDEGGTIRYLIPEAHDITDRKHNQGADRSSGLQFNTLFERAGDRILFISLPSKMPFFDSKGNISGLLGIGSYSLENKLTDEKLLQSEERWRTIVENELECVKVLDREGRVLEINPAGLEMIQATFDQVQGQKVVGLVAEEDEVAFNEMIDAVFRGENCHLVFDIIGLQGRRLTLESNSVPIRDSGPDGHIKALLGVTRDITESKKIEKALRDLAITFSNLSGRQFYEAVSKHLAEAMNLDYVFAGSLSEKKDKIILLGGYANGKVMGELEYDFIGTPCEMVIGKTTCIYSSSVQTSFPEDNFLVEMGLESYIGSPVFDKEKKPIGIVVGLSTRPLEKNSDIIGPFFNIFIDRISGEMQRDKVQMALEESELRMKDIIFSMADWVFEIDNLGKYTFSSVHSINILGIPSEDMIGTSPFDTMPEAEAEKQKKFFASISAEKTAMRDVENLRINKDGNEVYLLTNAVPVLDEMGNLKGYRGVSKDITEKKRADLLLKDSLDRSLKEQSIIQDIATSSLFYESDVDHFIRRITENGQMAIAVERLSVWKLSDEKDVLICVDLFEKQLNRHSYGDKMKLLELKEAIEYLIENKYIATDEPLTDPRTTAIANIYLKPNGVTSLLYTVIRTGDVNSGVLCFEYTSRQHKWQPDEISFASQLADQIAIALLNIERSNAKIELNHQLKLQGVLMNMAAMYICLPLDKVSRTIDNSLADIAEVFNAQRITVFRYDFKNQLLLPQNEYTRAGLEPAFRNIKSLDLKEMTDWDIESHMRGELIFIDDTKDIREGKLINMFRKTGSLKGLSVPMLAKGECIGFISIGWKNNFKQPSEEELQLLRVLALMIVNLYGRRTIEESLRRSEEKYRDLVENINDIFFTLDTNGIITYISPQASNFYQYSTEELIGHPFNKIVHPEYHQKSRQYFQDTIEGSSGIWEFMYSDKNGQVGWGQTSCRPITENGKISGIRGLLSDITKRKLSDEKISMLAQALQSISECVSITDMSDRIIFVNNAFLKIYQYELQEVIGKEIAMVRSDKNAVEIIREILPQASNGVWQGELINRRKDGTDFPVFLSTSRILDIKGEPIALIGITTDITRRKNEEKALRLSEEKFRKSFYTSPDAITITRINDGRFVSINRGFTNLTGYTEEEISGKTSFAIKLWKDLSDRRKLIAALKETGSVHNLEAKFRLKNGCFRTILMSASVIDIDGDSHIISLTRDIEEIKKTQDALKESEERFKQVVETAEEWIWEVDENGLFTYSSSVVEKLLGYTPEELIGNIHFYDLFAPESREALKTEALQVFKRRQRFHKFQNPNVRKDGKVIILETSGIPVEDGKGNLKGYRATDSDITERLAFIEELKKLSIGIEQSPASIIISNLEGDIEYVNPRFTELTGYSSDEAKGQNPRILKSGYTNNEVYKDLWSKISAGKEWRGEFYNKKKNGELFWEAASISPIHDDRGNITHYIAVKEDITDKKEATSRLFDAIIETEERERLRYSNEIHDGLGPILSTINLYFQMLSENSDPVQKKFILQKTNICINEAIQTIKEISYNLSPNVLNNFGIVSGIRNFISRVNETGKIFIEFKSNTEKRFEKNIEVTIYRIITELINNTVKYSGASNARIIFNLSQEPAKISLKYFDNGCGFDVEETFTKGKGLGLSNIHSRISTLNGKFEIEASPGNGMNAMIEIKLSKQL